MAGHKFSCMLICVYAVRKHTMIRAYKVTKKNPYIQIYGEKSAKKVKIVWRWRGLGEQMIRLRSTINNNLHQFAKENLVKKNAESIVA